MRHLKPILFVSTILAAVVAFVVPASADPGATLDSVDREDCVLTVNITVQDAGTYFLVVWDDGEIIGTDSVEAAEGASTSLTFTIVQNVNAGNPGLGLNIADSAEGGVVFDSLDPYDFEGSDDIAKACEEGGGVLTTTTTEGPSTTVGETSTTAAAPVTTAPANAPANTPAPAPAPAAAAPAQAVAAQAAYTG